MGKGWGDARGGGNGRAVLSRRVRVRPQDRRSCWSEPPYSGEENLGKGNGKSPEEGPYLTSKQNDSAAR